MKASIAKFGFWGAIVAQRSTRHVLAGNHRLMAARELGLGEVPVVWVDVSDERARAILAADNRTSDLGGYDDAALAELLSHLSQDDLLDGTGYTLDDLDDLIGSMAGEPVEDEVDTSEQLGAVEYMIIVEGLSIAQQAELYDELTNRGFRVKEMMV